MAARKVPGSDEAWRVDAAGHRLDRFERDVCDRDPCLRKPARASVELPRRELDPVDERVLAGNLDGRLVDVDCRHRGEAQPGC